MPKKILYGLIFFLFTNTILHCSQNYKVEYLTTEDGLPQNYVFYFYQDSKGFLWFGTRNGLCRYDGYNFLTFVNEPFDTTSISGNVITSIKEDSKSNLWIGTLNSGLNYYNRKTNKFIRYMHDTEDPASIGNNQIRYLEISQDDELWIFTTKGLYHYFPGKKDFKLPFDIDPALNDFIKKSILTCTINKYGEIFFIASHMPNNKRIIIRIDRNKLKILDSLTIFGMSIVDCDEDGNIVTLLKENSGLKRLNILNRENGNILKTINIDRRLSPKDVYPKITIDKNYDLWMLVHGRGDADNSQIPGINCLFNLGHINKLDSISPDKGIKNVNFIDIYYGNPLIVDNADIIWTRSLDGLVKLLVINPTLSNILSAPNKKYVENKNIRSLYEDNQGNILAGSDSGLYIFNHKTEEWYYKNHVGQSGFLNRNVNVIYNDRGSRIMLGTNNGINLYNPPKDKISRFNNKPFETFTLSSRKIWSIHRDKNNYLWVGTSYGLFIFDENDRFVKQIFLKQNPNQGIWTIFEDNKNNLWLGTEFGLLKRIPDTFEFIAYEHNPKDTNSISGNNIWSICEDNNGNLWVGAYGAGISRYNHEKENFTSYSLSDGLPDNGITSILCDSSNRLWMGSSKGIIRFDIENNKFDLFTTEEGFINNEYNFHAYCKSHDGYLMFGGSKGITSFHPDGFMKNNFIPPIVITSFSIFNKRVANELFDGDTVRLAWDDEYFAFEFSALDYRNPKQNQYAYKLKGYDKDWIMLGNRRNASFSHVDPGEYILRVKGSNSHGVWNEEGISIYVSIIPPFWMTTWFKVLVILLLGGTILIFFIYRVNEKRKREEMKRRLAVSQLRALQSQMNPHFIFNSLNSILNLIYQNEQELSTQYLVKFSRLLRNLLEHSRMTMITLEQEIEYLTMYIELEALRFNHEFDFNIDIEDDIKTDKTYVPTLIIQPYVENAIRHGNIHKIKDGFVKIDFKLKENYLLCEIRDNGIGRKKAEELKSKYSDKSLGMKVNKERLDLLNSRIEITDNYDNSGEAQGTTVQIMLNLKTEISDAH